MSSDLTRRRITTYIAGAGLIGGVLGAKAESKRPLASFDRSQSGSTDPLMRNLVWEQGRSVIEFGARMNRKDSDDAALDAAIAALPDQGGVIFVPPFDQGRSLVLNASHTWTKPNVAIVGAGANRSNIITTTGHNSDVFVPSAAAYAPILAGLTWTVYGSTGTAPAFLFNSSGVGAPRILDIAAAGNLHSIANLGGANSRVEGLRVTGLKPGVGIGLSYTGSGEVHRVLNCDMENARGQDPYAGVFIASGSAFELVATQAIKMGVPLYVKPPAGASVFSIVLLDWWSDTSANTGMILDGTKGTIARIKASTSWFSSCNRGIDVLGNVWGCRLGDGCEIYDNYSDGIRIAAAATLKGLAIDGARIAGNGTGGRDVLASGINVVGSTEDFDIRNTDFGPVSDFGANSYADISLGPRVDNYSITASRFARMDHRPAVVGYTRATTRIAASNRGWNP